VNSAIAFDTLGGVQAITRTGAVVHAAVGAITTVIDHGAHAGVPVYPDRLAIARSRRSDCTRWISSPRCSRAPRPIACPRGEASRRRAAEQVRLAKVRIQGL